MWVGAPLRSPLYREIDAVIAGSQITLHSPRTEASRTPPNRDGFTYFDTDDRGAGVILQVRKSSAWHRAQALDSVQLRIRLWPS